MIKNQMWTGNKVMDMCVKYGLYTCGTDDEYMDIIYFVDHSEPKDENIRCVALDILIHSDPDKGNTLGYIMCLLANECVTVTYTLDGDEGIDFPDYRMYKKMQASLEKGGE